MVRVLEDTSGFLRQLLSIEGDVSIQVPPNLPQEIDRAAVEAKEELECKSVCVDTTRKY